jgi:hypothetical protein
MDFTYTTKEENGALKLAFSGPIDEDADFPEVAPGKYQGVEVDLNAVTAINSVGIREWLEWIKTFSEQTPLKLMRCPKAIVFQFNMVEGFLPAKANVGSFYVPFFCEACDQEENLLFSIGKEVTAGSGSFKIMFDPAAGAKCKDCGKVMDMDVTEAKYFQFLKKI